jgi:dinuclear metal center YbgI/SA1388 family protein
MPLELQDIVDTLEAIAPPRYAASWDNSGLQIGAPEHRIRSVMVALDITAAVVREALQKKANLIVTHHPLFFSPIRQVRTDSGTGRLLQQLLSADIAVYAAHTNLDRVRDGVNDVLGRALGLETWSPMEDLSDPESAGWGRIGSLESKKPLKSFIEELKGRLQLGSLRVIGATRIGVQKIAWCSGSGASLLPVVVRHRPDLFVTGDIKYHDALNFQAEGLTVLDIGHFASEQGIRVALARKLRQALDKLGKPVPIYTARSERDPFKIA